MMRRGMKRIGAIAVAAAMSFSVVTSTTAFAAGSTANPEYQKRFETMYGKITDPSNGYFSQEGIPYHSVETLMVEAPDYGHVTTSEAFSYYMWLEALNGKFSGNFSGFQKSWDIAEKYIIPSKDDQPESSMSKYNPDSPATYAPEGETPDKYPAQLDKGVSVGKDPIGNELKSAYGSSMIYGMHWILDVDNWYGFGKRGDGTSRPAYFNTFQRGEEESTWETIPQPSWDVFKFGGTNGYLDLFTKDSSGYSKQFKYTNAPDADARAIQATYWANQWAKESGASVGTQVSKASKMGDYLRYAMYDKYFKKIGSTAAGTGKDSAAYLMSWYYAWGGGIEANWAWVIGSSHNHFGYQNPLTAWVLANDSDFKPKGATATTDWAKSLDRQIEFYTWLQSAEGAIAGGASNSYKGRYETWPAGTSTFYGMGYVENPVYADPGSNTWMGMQTWSMQRMAEYYYKTNDTKVKALLDKWAKWANSEIKWAADGTFQIPSTLDWDGQPETWTGTAKDNSNLHVTVVNYGTDLGVASSLANALAYYGKASGDVTSQQNAKKLLDAMWNNYQDSKGICVPEPRQDYLKRFASQTVYVPSGWTGKMPNGDPINSSSTFLSIRSKYKQDPEYSRVMAAISAGTAPVMKYHRFWAQSEFAVANGVYAILYPDPGPLPGTDGDLNGDGTVDAIDLALFKTYLLKGGSVKNADMNHDSSIDAIDFALLKKVLLK